jgi:uncharacterized phage-associated protein
LEAKDYSETMLDIVEHQRQIFNQMNEEMDYDVKKSLRATVDGLQKCYKKYSLATQPVVFNYFKKLKNDGHLMQMFRDQVSKAEMMQKMQEAFSEMKSHGYDAYDKDLSGKQFWEKYLVLRGNLVKTLDKVMPMAYKHELFTKRYYEKYMWPEKAPNIEFEQENTESYLQMAEVLYVAEKLAEYSVDYRLPEEDKKRANLPTLEKKFSKELDDMATKYSSMSAKEQENTRKYVSDAIGKLKNIDLPESNPDLYNKLVQTLEQMM